MEALQDFVSSVKSIPIKVLKDFYHHDKPVKLIRNTVKKHNS